MNVQEILKRLGNEQLKQLAQADSAEELEKMAQEQNHALTAEEAEVVFAALAPLRGKQPIDDADLFEVSGGFWNPLNPNPYPKKTTTPYT